MIIADESWEPALDLKGVRLSPRQEIVRMFYKDMWDQANYSLIQRIFHEEFTFRGSLGPELRGHAQFADYVRWVTDSFEHYTSDIRDIVEGNNCVSARLRFHGFHRKPLFNIPPTGRHVWWYGAPFFTFDGDKVRDLWVLGDIYGLIGRLQEGPTGESGFKTSN